MRNNDKSLDRNKSENTSLLPCIDNRKQGKKRFLSNASK